MPYTRYAIWWVPHPGSALAGFGAAWTGWCADRGLTSPATARAALSRGWPGVPGGVARQGLHANVRSPFRLPEGRSVWALESALAALAARTPAIRMPRLALTVLDGRVVLAPSHPDQAVARLLRQVVGKVRAVQVGTGSPGPGRDCAPALERFHVPLTDRLDLGSASEVASELEPMLKDVLAHRPILGDLALAGDPGGGRPWRVLDRFPLQGDAPVDGPQLPLEMACLGPRLWTPLRLRAPAAETRV